MEPWHQRPFLCVDTETTGVDCWTDRIVEVGCVTIQPDGTPYNGWAAIINPGVEVPDGAAEIHGITTERCREEGAAPADVLGVLANHISHAALKGWPVVIYNARFDWPLLLTEADRHGIEFPVSAAILDPYVIDRMVDRYRKGKRQLGMVAAHYGVELAAEDAHGALADATASGQIMRAIIDRNPKMRDHTLTGIVLRQVVGHEKDRQNFVSYMRTNVDPTFDSPAGWPIPVERAA